jgi:hypothetical protein
MQRLHFNPFVCPGAHSAAGSQLNARRAPNGLIETLGSQPFHESAHQPIDQLRH